MFDDLFSRLGITERAETRTQLVLKHNCVPVSSHAPRRLPAACSTPIGNGLSAAWPATASAVRRRSRSGSPIRGKLLSRRGRHAGSVKGHQGIQVDSIPLLVLIAHCQSHCSGVLAL